MDKRKSNKLIKKDPIKAINYLSSNFKGYKIEDLDLILSKLELRSCLKMRIKDFFINPLCFMKNTFNQEDRSFLKIMFTILLKLQSCPCVYKKHELNYKSKSKFGGGDVFDSRRKPVNKQASKGMH